MLARDGEAPSVSADRTAQKTPGDETGCAIAIGLGVPGRGGSELESVRCLADPSCRYALRARGIVEGLRLDQKRPDSVSLLRGVLKREERVW